MTGPTTYLQRRGDSLSFRISVPGDLRGVLGIRELVRALRTEDSAVAVPYALELAARAKRMFFEARALMSKDGKDKKLDEESSIWVKLKHHREMWALRDKHETEKDKLHDHYHQRLRELQARLEGTHEALSRVGTGAAVPRRKKVAHTLADTIPIWKRLKKPAPASVEVYEYAVKRFTSLYPGLGVADIERAHIRDYIEVLQDQKKAAKTIHKDVGAIRTLLGIAMHEDWIESNPASKVLLPKDDGDDIRRFTLDELKAIFSSPVFAEGARPKAGKGEAAFWVPLLLLWTGARREEICQLTTKDVREADDVSYLSINPREDDGRVKADESRRTVPVHPTLRELGFLDYVEQRRKDGGGLLFPLLKPNKRGQRGAKWGDWWSRYVRQTVKITDRLASPAHSFRHTFITECRRLNLRDDYERGLVGHTGGARRDAHDNYGELLVSALAEQMGKIEFRGLDLAHLQRSRRTTK